MKLGKSLLVVAVLGLMVAVTTLFTVYQSERAMVSRLGNLAMADGQVKIYQPGLHIKLPFVDKVYYLDTRLQTLEEQSSRIMTKSKKDLIVDSFIKWRIKNFPEYFTSTAGNKLKAETLLRQKVVDGLRAEFGRREVREVVSGERLEVMEAVKENANKSAKGLGIEVIDVRIKRIDLPPEVSESVFNRMRTERQRIAADHRAKGEERALMLRANADKNKTVILAESEAEALRIRGKGDAEAARIYANAYSKDSEFYSFYRSLEGYKASLKPEQDIFIMKPDSDFFKYLNNANARKKG